MEDARRISLSELLHLGRPLTGATTLSVTPLVQPRLPPSGHRSASCAPLAPAQEPLAPLSFQSINTPVVLVGTLGLPGDDDGSHACRSRNHCFSFSDGSARVCCAVLDVDIAVVGREIRALAWNFVPLPRGGGVLEIIRWSLPEPASTGSVPPRFPQIGERSRARSCAWGMLVSVSPVFSVPVVENGDCEGKPRGDAKGSACSVGFLTEVATCKCDPCARAKSVKDLHHSLRGGNAHSFSERVIVYFRGPSSSWRPLLSKLAGSVVTISSLKRKYVSAGGGESLVLVTTERTIVYRDMKRVAHGFVERGAHLRKGELGTYCGVVTGIFKKGMIVELDKKEVWLLSADSLLDLPHSLRVGAVVTVKNVHFIRPNFSWMRVLLLGCCIKAVIEVKSFSLVDTRCHFLDRSCSLLWDFMYSLPLSVRFWVLLLISSFQYKFAGIFSDKEILGSRKKEGLVQTYCRLSLPSSVFEDQQVAFEDFCTHDRCSCRNNVKYSPLKLVVPMSNFMTKCKRIWMSIVSQVKVNAVTRENNTVSQLHCEEKCHRMIKQIMSSEELGLILVGSLQVSPSSGRLQLVDSTGCINVVIPDLSPNFDEQIVYEVEDYTLVMEGFPLQLDSVVLHKSDPLSCRSILRRFQLLEELHELIVYVHFYVTNMRCLNSHLLYSVVGVDDIMGSNDGCFHLLVVTHKFSHNQNPPNILNKPNAFAEAILLPYDLILHRQCQDIQPAEIYELNECAEGIPCFITFTSITYQGYLLPCNLSQGDDYSLDTSTDKQGVQRILLEFDSSSIKKYQFLHIGGYYILKSSKEDLSYSKGYTDYLDSTKVLITSQTCLWSLRFSLGKFLLPCMTRLCQLLGTIENDVSPFEVLCQRERLIYHCAQMTDKNLDAHLHLSGEAIKLLKKSELLVTDLTKPHKTMEVLSVSSFIQVMKSMSLQFAGSAVHQRKLPEGKLLSLRGNILDIHIYHHNHCDGNSECSHNIPGDCTLCIHLYEGHHVVKVRGTLGKSVYPLGLGPGANATFHRILMMLNARREFELMMIPVSFIVVNYAEKLNNLHCTRSLLPLPKSFIFSSNLDSRNESLHMVSARLIAELIHCSHNTMVRLHCRVTGAFILLLEDQVKLKNLQSTKKFKMPSIKIPLAGFILDDGSSSCCCWTDYERAETLLQLQETTSQSFLSCHRTSSLKGNSQSQVTLGYLLNKMLKKHHRIIIRNCGANIGWSSMDIAFSVDSNKAVTSLEEDILRFIILNAQNGPNLNVIGHMLNLDELPQFKEVFTEADFAEQSMKNLWAEEIYLADPLMESRNLMKELQTS